MDPAPDPIPSHPLTPHSPVVVPITERPDRDGEGLPNRVQVVLDHLSLVADGEPGDTQDMSRVFVGEL